jgi:hypothetical protein
MSVWLECKNTREEDGWKGGEKGGGEREKNAGGKWGEGGYERE